MKSKVVIMAVAVTMITACRTAEHVTIVERVKTDTLYQVKVQRDSIHVRDSITTYTQGDTVYRDRWHIEWRERWRTDTIRESRTDSIPYPVEVIREVPAEIPRWQQWLMYLGGGVIVFVVVALGFKFFKN